mmetsp:Transcript_113899/g.318185  ORF Transcript_113899/g.318185 Transcript_113899/m.318185 type:complete len:207 (+) Transcript_113899:938-1558(+)
MESGVGDEGDLLRLEADELEHLDEFLLDLVEPGLVPSARVHLVDSDEELVNSEEVEQTGVLARLALFDSKLGVGLGDGGLETSLLGGDEQHTHVRSGGSGDHVLDVILVSGGIHDSVVVLLGEELLGVALDGDTTLALFLARIKVVRKAERGLSLFLGDGLELGHFTLGNAAHLEDQVTACGRLSSVDVSADNKRQVLLTLRHGCY